MPILVVIPCLNEEAHIEQIAQQLLRSDLPLRIVIADGGSTDKSIGIIQKLAAAHENIIYLHNPKRIQSAAVNITVAHYGHDCEFLIRIDAHAAYPDDYCQLLVDEAQATKAASIVVSMESQGTTPFQKAVAIAQNSRLGNGGSAHRLPPTQGRWVDHGHHALMRLDAFNAVGGYSNNFMANEDAELDIRLFHSGYKIWLTAKTSIIYYPRGTPLALLRQYKLYGNARQRTLTRHKTKPKLRQVLPLFVFPSLLLALLFPLWTWAIIPLFIWAAICMLYASWLGNSMSGIAAMIMHLGWSAGFWQGMLTTKSTPDE